MRVPRNAPCPCGSGRKFKKCCGLTRDLERALERRLEEASAAIMELAALPGLYPRLRPSGQAFAAWADGVAAGTRDEPQLEEAIALIEPDERARIERGHAAENPAAWRRLVERLGDEKLAEEAVLAGAVVAALRERRPPEPDAIALVEELEDIRADPCEPLAYCFDAADLWSIDESAQADAALAAIPDHLDDDAYEARWNEVLTAEADRLTTPWHREQIARLVARVPGRLPLSGYPLASTAIGEGCERFEWDEEFRRRLAWLLLCDSLTRVQVTELRAALAA